MDVVSNTKSPATVTKKIETKVAVRSYINGTAVASSSSETLQLINPANGRLSITLPAGSALDAIKAVASAKKAFEKGPWTNFSNATRQSLLHSFANLIEEYALELDRLDAEDMGKPISLEFGNAMSAANLLRYSVNAMESLSGDAYRSDKSCLIAQQLVPRGVVAAVVPWNFPTLSAMTKVAPALAAGNCVVLKPSEQSPQSASRLAELATQAGIPPGVLNVVQGRGDIVARTLGLHNHVNMIAFTGSTAVGKLILQYAGQSNMKVAHVECGGKSPQIVFADCHDLDAVADSIVDLILLNQGQLCVTGSRVIVEDKIELELVEKIIQRFKTVRPGDPLEAATTYGPLPSRQQLKRVLGYIEAGKKTADVLYGGQRFDFNNGYFVEPTLFGNVVADDPLFQEEIFGPVLTITRFRTLDQAVELANSTPYGLAAYAWTTSLNNGMRLSTEVDAGMVTVNSSTPTGEGSQAISTEPCGLSGVGTEFGLAGLASYSRAQVRWFNH